MKLKINYANSLIDPTQKFWYIPINENANTGIISTLEEKKWTLLADTTIINEDKFFNESTQFAILRDPYEHWILSFVSYLKNSNLNTAGLENVLSSVYNDNFFELYFKWAPFFRSKWQSNTFLNHPDLEKINFFQINEKLGYQLSKWFQLHDEIIPFNNNIVGYKEKNKIYQGINSFLFDYKNQKIKNKIIKHLKPDYDFINGINFYAR